MRKAVRAIIIHEAKLLVVHRNKFGTEYDTLPGGKIEIGETPEQALVREVAEETTITFSGPRFIALEHAGLPWGDQYIYICDYTSGEPQLHPQSEENTIHQMGRNLYQPMWLSLNELSEKPFRSEKLKQLILSSVQSSWPDAPIEFSS